jgi:NADH:ubiquinone oxidoreductase subunit 5 (subunit L)/multisubunit Na+/H+ antiporter MnhA subunit
MKLLLVKVTILIALLSLGAATSYFSQEYSWSKAFQLGVLIALAVLAGTAIIFYILSLLLTPLLAKRENKHEEEPIEEEPYIVPKEERIIRHTTKEEYAEHNSNERETVYEAQQILREMKQDQGAIAEVLLILPVDLAFLLAKESIENLFWGKIREEDREAGTILGTAGLGSNPQEIKITLNAMTDRSTSISIISKSPLKKQSEKKNASYIKKISDFLRKKERVYIE